MKPGNRSRPRPLSHPKRPKRNKPKRLPLKRPRPSRRNESKRLLCPLLRSNRCQGRRFPLQTTLANHFQKLDRATAEVDHLICFAVKSNSNKAVLRTLAKLGSGFDIVSGGELQRVIEAGGDPHKCAFAGVGKSEAEIEFALRKGVYTFNVESEAELERINAIAARATKRAPVAVRINPDVQAGTHKKITTGTYENKFGIAFEKVEAIYERAARLKHLHLRGVQMHIGSQITEVTPFEQAVW